MFRLRENLQKLILSVKKFIFRYRICAELMFFQNRTLPKRLRFILNMKFHPFVLMENISLLPQNLQNEGIIFTAFIVLEMIDLVFSFLFAFQVKNIRKATIDEYRKSQMKWFLRWHLFLSTRLKKSRTRECAEFFTFSLFTLHFSLIRRVRIFWEVIGKSE